MPRSGTPPWPRPARRSRCLHGCMRDHPGRQGAGIRPRLIPLGFQPLDGCLARGVRGLLARRGGALEDAGGDQRRPGGISTVAGQLMPAGEAALRGSDPGLPFPPRRVPAFPSKTGGKHEDRRGDVLHRLFHVRRRSSPLALEERGFDSLWAPEHSHIPLVRSSRIPAAASCRKQYYDVMDSFVTLDRGGDGLPAPCWSAPASAWWCSATRSRRRNRSPRSTRSPAGVSCSASAMAGTRRGDRGPRHRLRHPPQAGAGADRGDAGDLDQIRSPNTTASSSTSTPMMTWPKPVQKPHPPIIVGGAFPLGRQARGTLRQWLDAAPRAQALCGCCGAGPANPRHAGRGRRAAAASRSPSGASRGPRRAAGRPRPRRAAGGAEPGGREARRDPAGARSLAN